MNKILSKKFDDNNNFDMTNGFNLPQHPRSLNRNVRIKNLDKINYENRLIL